MTFGCKRSSSHRKVSIAKYLIYPHIKFERDRLNICRVRVFASSESPGRRGGVAKTIISRTLRLVIHTCMMLVSLRLRPPSCTLLRLHWTKNAQGTMR